VVISWAIVKASNYEAATSCCAGQYGNLPNNWEPWRWRSSSGGRVDELLIRIFFASDENVLPHRPYLATSMYSACNTLYCE
jgi:hypothetical protein